ncbi:MAG: hypothetical protein IPG04_15210 [Polyangiaceae bacterium]|nr:hypothetical protein [Polyangiaceae bacterium]
MSITFGPPGAVASTRRLPAAREPFIAQVRGTAHICTLEVEGRASPKTSMLSYDKDVDLTISLRARA